MNKRPSPTLSVVLTVEQVEAIQALALKHYPTDDPTRGNASQFMRFRGMPAIFAHEGIIVPAAPEPLASQPSTSDLRAIVASEVASALSNPATVAVLAQAIAHSMGHKR